MPSRALHKPHACAPRALAVFCLVAAAWTHGRAQTAATDEKAAWLLWKHHLENAGDHAAVAAACRDFEKTRPRDPFVAVSRGLQAWHLLKSGNRADAEAVFATLSAMRTGTAPARPSDDQRPFPLPLLLQTDSH